MLVTATRTPEEPINVPAVVDIVSAADLLRKLPRTTPDALRELPSVMLQKTSQGQGSPYIRGFTGFRTLMLVDGIRLNNSTFRDGPNQYWNTIDSLTLDRLELVRGPGSVLYGSDAIGGTVNALTRSRQEYGPGAHWDPGVSYRFSSAEQSHVGRAGVALNAGESLGFTGGATFKDYGDVRGGEDVGEQPETGYREGDADAKLEWRLSSEERLVLAFQSVNQDDAWRTHSTVYGLTWRGLTPGTDLTRVLDQDRRLTYLQYHATERAGWVEELHASLSFHEQDEREERWRADRRRENAGVDVDTLGASLQLQSATSVGRLVYGAEYYRDWVNSSYQRFAADGSMQLVRRQGPVADDANYDLFGAYVEDRLPVCGERLEFTLGGRFDAAAADARRVETAGGQPTSIEDSWNTVVGNGRVLARLDPEGKWILFSGVSQGFRAPNLSDLTRFDIADRGEIEVPALDLEPERYVSAEAGLKVRQGRVAAEAAFYHTWIEDQVTRIRTGMTVPTGEFVVEKRNSGRGYVQGVEITGSVELAGGLSLWGNFSWMQGTLDAPLVIGGPEVTEPISRLMPSTVNAGLRWEEERGRFWAEFATTVAATQDRLPLQDQRDVQRIPPGGTPGYEVYHLRAGWRPCPNFTLTAALENLSDADYRVHGSGVNEPGRNLILMAGLRF